MAELVAADSMVCSSNPAKDPIEQLQQVKATHGSK